MNNDLISRSALREEVKTLFWTGSYKSTILQLIDNAPTVEDRYGEGYAQGYLDGSTGADWKGGTE